MRLLIILFSVWKYYCSQDDIFGKIKKNTYPYLVFLFKKHFINIITLYFMRVVDVIT